MEDELPLGYLGPVQPDLQQELGQLLWGWELCGNCSAMESCPNEKCPWARAGTLQPFWDLYQRMSDAYYPERLGRQSAFSSHDELLRLMRKIQDNDDVAREALLVEHFDDLPAGCRPPTSIDQNRAFNTAASLLFMMDFGILHDGGNNSDGNTSLIPWRDPLSPRMFLAEAFPEARTSTEGRKIVDSLTATKLKKYGKLQLKATNDIRSHLVLDHDERTLWIFHHTTVLRESLKSSQEDVATCLLPRNLLLEVLDTLHLILFRPDPASHKLLESLISKHGFDGGLLAYVSVPYRSSTDPESSYSHFGDRLLALHDEMQSPRPHGWLQERLGRKRDTYMLMATMIGVFIAVLIGFLSLAVSCFQAWVGYQQWKHPVHDA